MTLIYHQRLLSVMPVIKVWWPGQRVQNDRSCGWKYYSPLDSLSPVIFPIDRRVDRNSCQVFRSVLFICYEHSNTRTEIRVASSCNIYEFTKVKRVKDDTNLLLCWRNVIQNVAKILYKTWFIFCWDENMSVKAKTPTLGYQNIVSTVIVEQLTLQLFLRMKPFSMVTTVYLLKFWSWKCDAWHFSLLCWHINSQPLRRRPSLRWF